MKDEPQQTADEEVRLMANKDEVRANWPDNWAANMVGGPQDCGSGSPPSDNWTFLCTRPVHNGGPHVAYGIDGDICRVWFDRP